MAIVPDSIIVTLIDKYVKPLFIGQVEKTDSERFLDILEDIGKAKSPIFISEKLCGILEDRFIRIHSKMKGDDEEYYNLLTQIVQSIENTLEETVSVWKDRVIYFRNVKEVWIACEPILDLIDTEEGSFDLLERQLRHVEKITYFLTNRLYFDDLIKILRNRRFNEDKIQKLQCKIIPKKLVRPVVIYISDDTRFHGMAGKYHPEIIKNGEDYRFKKSLPTDWLYYLTKVKIEDHYIDLKKY